MQLRSCLFTACSDDDSALPSSNKHLETYSSSDISTTTASSSASSSSTTSLQSDLSLITLPSIPSLQNLSPEALKLSVSHQFITKLNPPAKLSITCLAVDGQLIYVACVNEICVFERNSWKLLDTFGSRDSTSGSVKDVSFSDGKIFTAHQDCKIRVWKLTETKQHKQLATLPTTNNRLRRFILPKNYVMSAIMLNGSGSSTLTEPFTQALRMSGYGFGRNR